jgi:hypothetical protein
VAPLYVLKGSKGLFHGSLLQQLVKSGCLLELLSSVFMNALKPGLESRIRREASWTRRIIQTHACEDEDPHHTTNLP